MAVERSWEKIPARLFTQNGGLDGKVTLLSVSDFRVKQKVKIQSNTVPSSIFEVKKILSPTEMFVGPIDKNIQSRSDLSSYNVSDISFISAEEQFKAAVPKDDQGFATYEQEPVVARRVINIDEFGKPFSKTNPMPVDVEVVLDTVEINVDLNAFGESPDSALSVGSENGLITGTRHVLKIGSDLNLRVIDEQSNTTLNSIDSKLSNLNIEAMTESTQPDNIMVVGTLNGQKNSTKYGFVNNLRLQILDSHDRNADFSYADFGTKNQRVTAINYNSATFPGFTVRRVFSYTLVGNNYRRDNETWTII